MNMMIKEKNKTETIFAIPAQQVQNVFIDSEYHYATLPLPGTLVSPLSTKGDSRLTML